MNPDGMVALLNYRVSALHSICSYIYLPHAGGWHYTWVLFWFFCFASWPTWIQLTLHTGSTVSRR